MEKGALKIKSKGKMKKELRAYNSIKKPYY